jgi:hypothetical protein
MGVVGVTGSLPGQRLAVPREFLRVKPKDPSEQGLQTALLKQVSRKLAADEAVVMDAGFKLTAVRQARLKGFVLRLAKNFTARRNEPQPYSGTGRPPRYGAWGRPLARTYAGPDIAATAPDRVVTWPADGHQIRAEIWNNLGLPGVVPAPQNEPVVCKNYVHKELLKKFQQRRPQSQALVE